MLSQVIKQAPPSGIAAIADQMNDREKLMLVDWLTDQLSEHISDELAEGLACAFERAELGYSGTFTKRYPSPNAPVSVWQDWRLHRDSLLAGKGAI